VRLTKHHGLGNDFLVVATSEVPGDAAPAELARRLCDRRRGIGADGLLFLGPGTEGADARMVLHNADGSRAEMSGNGIRCLAQAVVRARGLTAADLVIETDAGPRRVAVQPGPDASTILASVSMGPVRSGRPPARWHEVPPAPGRPVAHLDLGNPHTVVAVDDVSEVDLVAVGRVLADVNLEVVAAGPEPDAVTMRVHERGAGITEACGTGACAAAAAAAAWGFVSAEREILVHMPGGDAKVQLGEEVVLTGPATFIADVVVP
jgi:diaminopimelate epimerase